MPPMETVEPSGTVAFRSFFNLLVWFMIEAWLLARFLFGFVIAFDCRFDHRSWKRSSKLIALDELRVSTCYLLLLSGDSRLRRNVHVYASLQKPVTYLGFMPCIFLF